MGDLRDWICQTFIRGPLSSAGQLAEPQIFNHILPHCGIHPLPANGRGTCACCSFSPGEKVRMRADVKHKLVWNDRPHPGPLLQGEGETFGAHIEISRDLICRTFILQMQRRRLACL